MRRDKSSKSIDKHMVNRVSEDLCNSYTMVCPPVRGDYPRALASELSPVQTDKSWYNYFYATLINVDLAQYKIFRAKVCDF